VQGNVIVIAFFDQQELGLFGSRACAQTLSPAVEATLPWLALVLISITMTA
jgi:hypothetical protein